VDAAELRRRDVSTLLHKIRRNDSNDVGAMSRGRMIPSPRAKKKKILLPIQIGE
jgi:hypothetical protein